LFFGASFYFFLLDASVAFSPVSSDQICPGTYLWVLKAAAPCRGDHVLENRAMCELTGADSVKTSGRTLDIRGHGDLGQFGLASCYRH
jgi:hypothetical protein